jgi:hypothetical protein
MMRRPTSSWNTLEGDLIASSDCAASNAAFAALLAASLIFPVFAVMPFAIPSAIAFPTSDASDFASLNPSIAALPASDAAVLISPCAALIPPATPVLKSFPNVFY